MLEEMFYEKRQKRKHHWRCCIIWFFCILFLIELVATLMMMRNVESHSSVPVGGFYIVMIAIIFIITAIAVVVIASSLEDALEHSYKKELQDFRFCAKVDDFKKDLGAKTIKLKLICDFEDDNGLGEMIVDKEVHFYVQKGYLDKLHIFACREGKEIWHCDTDDYKYFFNWFEPIFECEEAEE